MTYVSHSTGVILNAYPKEKLYQQIICLINVKKDAEGFDNVYGTEHLSKICVEQRDRYK